MQKKKLYEKRVERGFTQEQMADLLGIDQPQYSKGREEIQSLKLMSGKE